MGVHTQWNPCAFIFNLNENEQNIAPFRKLMISELFFIFLFYFIIFQIGENWKWIQGKKY